MKRSSTELVFNYPVRKSELQGSSKSEDILLLSFLSWIKRLASSFRLLDVGGDSGKEE
jgi:hypothetical protein